LGGVFVLLLIAAVVLAATKRIRFPFSVALVLVGVATSLAVGWVSW